MDSKTLNNRMKDLIEFCKSKDKCLYICKCSDESIHTLCELCFNMVNGGIELKGRKALLKNLLPLRVILHYLADVKNTDLSKKRKILYNSSQVLFPIIHKKIIPIVKRLVKNKNQKKKKKKIK